MWSFLLRLGHRSAPRGTFANSFGSWIWWNEKADRTAMFTPMELAAILDGGGKLGVSPKSQSAATMRIASFTTMGDKDVAKELNAIILKRLAIDDIFIDSCLVREFTDCSDVRWMACLDWYSIFRNSFQFFRMIHPQAGVILVDRSPSVGRNAFEDKDAIAISASDVQFVTANGRQAEIHLSGSRIVVLDVEAGMRLERS